MTKIKPRKTVYKGIEMRSRLEAGFAQWLDQWDLEWEYEPCAYASDVGQYLPDFRVQGVVIPEREEATVYVEVKPNTRDWRDDVHPRMWIIKQTDPGAILVLQVAGKHPLVAARPRDEWHPWVPARWIFAADAWPGQDGARLGLAQLIPPAHMPWPPGYWEAA